MSSLPWVRKAGLEIASLVLLLVLGWSIPIQAQNYYTQHAVGWHWYKEPQLEEATQQEVRKDPSAQIKAIRQNLALALDKALLNPTPEHVKHYIVLQNQWSDRASQFSRAWQWALLQHPLLDYSLTHPTNQLGRTVYLDNLTIAQTNAIQHLAKQQGLFFFYKGKCAYCRRFAPIIKRFSAYTHMPIIPIALDTTILPEFPVSRLDEGQAARFNVTTVPALFTVNPYTQKALPIAYGLISESDLRQRILEIAQATQEGAS